MSLVLPLELVPWAPPPPRGTPLLAVRLNAAPQRSKHLPQVIKRGRRAGKAGTRPDPRWEAWRDAMVLALRSWGAGRTCIVGPVLVDVQAIFKRPKDPRTSYVLDGITRPYPYPWHRGRVEFIGDPDHDQVVKAGVDVIKQAGLLGDDTLVIGYGGGPSRWYAAEGEAAHVEVRVWAG